MKDDRLKFVLDALKARGVRASPRLVESVLDLADAFVGRPGPAPFGRLPGESGAVERMRQLRKEGLSLRIIAERLNAEGVPTRTGAPWSKVMVGVILARTELV
jgi:Recombinase